MTWFDNYFAKTDAAGYEEIDLSYPYLACIKFVTNQLFNSDYEKLYFLAKLNSKTVCTKCHWTDPVSNDGKAMKAEPFQVLEILLNNTKDRLCLHSKIKNASSDSFLNLEELLHL